MNASQLLYTNTMHYSSYLEYYPDDSEEDESELYQGKVTKKDKQRRFRDYDAYEGSKGKKRKKDFSQARKNKRGEEI